MKSQTLVDEIEDIRKERMMGDYGKIVDKVIPVIDISDFQSRKKVISEEIWNAGKDLGFFKIVNHGISQEAIEVMFTVSEEFFSLSESKKKAYYMKDNMGWKCLSQVPPSTGTTDQSESLQMRKIDNELSPRIAEIKHHYDIMNKFESDCMALGLDMLLSISEKLGLSHNFFVKSFNHDSKNYNATLRMLNYFPVENNKTSPHFWRAGAHTDFGFLTLLFQRTGQSGLQICSGRDFLSKEWIPIDADDQSIVCNIGDMLRHLSGDILVSNFHRVVIPSDERLHASRKSIAFFCQPNNDTIILFHSHDYREPMTAGEYFKIRMAANYTDQRMYMDK